MSTGALTSLADTFLIGLNIFNAFVLFTHLHHVDSPLKKPIVTATFRLVTKFHSIPFLVSSTLAALLSITTCSAVQYNLDSNSNNNNTAMLIRAIVAAYTFACTSIFVKLSNHMIKLSVERVLELEKEVARHDIANFEPPSRTIMEAAVTPYKPFFAVESVGLERIPDGVPHFYVSNHSLYGLEMPVFLNHLYQKKGVFPRGLADHFHFATPNGPVLRAFGAVDGTRDNVDALMQTKHDVLVYPGGGHEVLKASNVPRYELMWKERLGFARCAIKHGYPILPCACVGTEDMFDALGDIPTGYKDMVIPIAVTSPGRVQKIYFWFGSPIPTKQYNGEYTNDEFAREVRDKAKAAIEAGIQELQERQRRDPERYLVDQFSSKLRRYFANLTKNDAEIIESLDEKASDAAGEDVDDSAGEKEYKLKMK